VVFQPAYYSYNIITQSNKCAVTFSQFLSSNAGNILLTLQHESKFIFDTKPSVYICGHKQLLSTKGPYNLIIFPQSVQSELIRLSGSQVCSLCLELKPDCFKATKQCQIV
jgi:isopentenyldiphosphate isomerase